MTELTERDLAIATLTGRYIERREHQETPQVHDLLAAAAELGDRAADELRTVLACYEAMRSVERSIAPLSPVGPTPDLTPPPTSVRSIS